MPGITSPGATPENLELDLDTNSIDKVKDQLRNISRWADRVSPFVCCYGATATFPALNALATYCTWTRPQNQDPWGFLLASDPTPQTIIRIPFDGLYSFYYITEYPGTIPASATRFSTWVETANTSDTGFGAPSWTALRQITHSVVASEPSDKNTLAFYTEVPLRANDSARVSLACNNALTGCVINTSSFKLTMPIPTRTV